ncbi:MAG: M14 family metallopeptidase [Wenzhouxiangellaceae bacterium]
MIKHLLPLLLFSTLAHADPVVDILPPLLPWQGASEQYLTSADDPWRTPAEASGLTDSPDYATTMDWLQRLAAASNQVNLQTIGDSAQGRAIRMAVVDRDGLSDATAIQESGRAIVLIHGGIHAGEIDGKDAGLMLLRDLTVKASLSSLLDQVSILFIPILNVDGHERRSPFNRINQRGPRQMGWRTNARNLNLNRDYAKLETEEVRALTATINIWQPDLYIDVHVTDGADYQYDITYGWNGPHGWSPSIANWLDDSLRPAVNRALREQGHVPGPLIFAVNGRDMDAGMVSWTATPRYSNGWGDARHMATILVENHSLKPYRQRVLGTYVMLRSALQVAGAERESLRQATLQDRFAARDQVPLGFAAGDQNGSIRFQGIRSRSELSAISGGLVTRWLGENDEREIPLVVMDKATVSVKRPRFYYLPAAWYPLANRLRDQGILVDELSGEATLEVQRYRLPEARLDADNTPFEGRARYQSGEPQSETVSIHFQAGDFRIDTRQSLGTLAVLLLEPQSPDSLFQWGYLSSILQATEYFEAYAMEPLAARMLAEDAELAQAFRRKIAEDPAFAGDARARLHWFYERSPYFDQQYQVYPVYRQFE